MEIIVISDNAPLNPFKQSFRILGEHLRRRAVRESMEKHSVTFQSPGTFFNEETTKPIDSWDTELALALSLDIVERYNARPYAFYFSTRIRGEDDLDSKVSATSGRYFLGGRLMKKEEIEREIPDSGILVSNMEMNGWKHVIRTSQGNFQPFEENDALLPVAQLEKVV